MSDEAQDLALLTDLKAYKERKEQVERLEGIAKQYSNYLQITAQALANPGGGIREILIPSAYPSREKLAELATELNEAKEALQRLWDHLNDRGFPQA